MSAKIQKLICIVALIAALISTQAAALLETMYDPSHYFVGQMRINDVYSTWSWYLTTYYNDYQGAMDDQFVATGTTEVYGVFMSRIQPETFYTFSVPIEISEDIQLESGDILPSATQWFNVVPAEYFNEIEPSNGTRYTFTGDPLSLLNPDMYKMYFDEEQGLIHVVFYLTEGYIEEHKELLEHVYLVLSLGQSVVINERPDNIIYGQTEVLPSGIYTQLLNQIISKLEVISSQGSGITQAQVNAAIREAMEYERQKEKQEILVGGQEALTEVQSQVAGYQEQIMQGAMSGQMVAGLFDLSSPAVLTMPLVKIPQIGNIVPEMILFEGQQYNITEMLDDFLPEILIKLVRTLNAVLLLRYVALEAFRLFNRFLNGGDVVG